jgi:hypothetical protein
MADGSSMDALEVGGRIRILGIGVGDDVRWRPPPDHGARAGDTVIAVTAPGGLGDLLSLVRGGPPVTEVFTDTVDAAGDGFTAET